MPGAEPPSVPALRRFAPLLLCAAAIWLEAPSAAAQDSWSAVILLYHHVSDTTPRSTSISPANFDRHLDYLAEQGYTVRSADEIVAALIDGRQLAPKTVALTFDDAYRSIYTEALPRLERRGWPFTVFVSTDSIDRAYSSFMSWDELRDLEARGGTVANHGASHAHLLRHIEGEGDAVWRTRISGDILAAQKRLAAELERPSALFAYPYGEFDVALESLVRDLGLIAFGQQSGPIGPGSGMQQLARFPMASGFDSIPSLAEKLRTRPLPVSVRAPASRLLAPGSSAPELELEIAAGPYRREAMRCYVAGQEPALVSWSGNIVTIRARAPLGAGRSKYNCTAPSATENGVFYWYSHLWIQPNDDGSWYPD